MAGKYRVHLSEDEQKQLHDLITKGKSSAARIRCAHILLAADENGPRQKDEAVAQAYHCHPDTVRNVRRRYVERGLAAALGRRSRPQPPRPALLDGEGQARLMLLACSAPPDGRARWTLQLLANHLVELEVVEAISRQTVMRELKKTN